MERIDIVLGDWSDDGHGESEKYPILVNKSKKEMQDAYKASCKALGISFNHNEDFTGLEGSYDEQRDRQICSEYEDSRLSEHVIEVLREHGCDVMFNGYNLVDTIEEEEFVSEDMLVALLMWFIKYSMPDFEWKKVDEKDSIPTFNGFWDDNLNVQIGYGLYQ